MFQGSIVALVTPMHDNGGLDQESLGKLIEYHIEQGTDGIVSVGTTGESATLSSKEHCEVIRWTVEKVAKRVPVIAGTGSNSTSEAIELTRNAKEIGADACLLVTPYYNKPTQHGLIEHFKTIAHAVDIPQLLYNVPGRTVCDMSPETVQQLAKIDNIVGIKEATGEIERVTWLKEHCPEAFTILSGDDASAMDLMFAGGQGVISVTANVAPKAMHLLCELALAGKQKEAKEVNDSLMALHQNLFYEANPIPVKWALFRMGLIKSGIRLPLTKLSEQYHALLESDLKKVGLL